MALPVYWDGTGVGGSIPASNSNFEETDADFITRARAQGWGCNSSAVGINLTRWKTTSDVFPNDQYAKCRWNTSQGTTTGNGVAVRVSASTLASCYGLVVYGNGDVAVLKVIDGVYSATMTADSAVMTTQGIMELRVTGGATTVLDVYINDVKNETLSTTDSTDPILSGQAGILMRLITASCGGNHNHLDWEAGELAAPPSGSIAPIIRQYQSHLLGGS